jgi:hypothetical protein
LLPTASSRSLPERATSSPSDAGTRIGPMI